MLFAGGSAVYNNMKDRIDIMPKNINNQDLDTNELENESEFKAPDFPLTDINGNVVSLSDFQGKTVVLNFWASWCGPCKKEMPDFNELYEEEIKDNEDVVFLAINLTDGKRETVDKVKEFIEKNEYTLPVLFDDKGLAAYYYGVDSIPVTVVVDKDGNIEKGIIGMTDKETIKDIIEEVNK